MSPLPGLPSNRGRLLPDFGLASAIAAAFALAAACHGEEREDRPLRCEALPLEGGRVSLRIDGRERLRWNPDPLSPRPYFFPLNGPAGEPLTRMGHPGAPNHDHHRSVWFAHQDVAGVDFWSDSGGGRVRQTGWLAMEDGDEGAFLAVRLVWLGPGEEALLEQTVVVAVRPLDNGECEVELRSVFLPGGDRQETLLGRTNFGLLAVRVAKTVSGHFGGGLLRDSEGRQGEEEVFGQRARWVDYEGRVAAGLGPERRWEVEGVTFFDHPDNPRHPSRWHVREDGWMGASLCFDEPWAVRREGGLTLRYLLHARSGALDPAGAEARFEAFAARPGWRVVSSERPHRQFEIVEADTGEAVGREGSAGEN